MGDSSSSLARPTTLSFWKVLLSSPSHDSLHASSMSMGPMSLTISFPVPPFSPTSNLFRSPLVFLSLTTHIWPFPSHYNYPLPQGPIVSSQHTTIHFDRALSPAHKNILNHNLHDMHFLSTIDPKAHFLVDSLRSPTLHTIHLPSCHCSHGHCPSNLWFDTNCKINHHHLKKAIFSYASSPSTHILHRSYRRLLRTKKQHFLTKKRQEIITSLHHTPFYQRNTTLVIFSFKIGAPMLIACTMTLTNWIHFESTHTSYELSRSTTYRMSREFVACAIWRLSPKIISFSIVPSIMRFEDTTTTFSITPTHQSPPFNI